MPHARLPGGIGLEYDTFGDPARPAVLLVMGLGLQMIEWDAGWCAELAGRGYLVIRFDNRDCGLSTGPTGKVDFAHLVATLRRGEVPVVPYTLGDMADDAAALLDHLGIATAHVVGVSMGGMIGQVLAVRHPDRVRSLVSIMSTTGDPAVGRPTPEGYAVLTDPPPPERAAAIAHSVEARRVIGSPGHFDQAAATAAATAAHNRAFRPDGVGRQLAAVLAAGDRTPALRTVRAPTLVIHGTEDPLIDSSGGAATALAIPGATFLEVPGMGHDLPAAFLPGILDAITEHWAAAGRR